MTSIPMHPWEPLTIDIAGHTHHLSEVPDSVRDEYVTKLAALAIGASEYGGPDDCRESGIVLRDGQPFHYERDGDYFDAWDPLNDDGDAFRLAIKMNLLSKGHPRLSPNDSDVDRCASARRSIVLMAARTVGGKS